MKKIEFWLVKVFDYIPDLEKFRVHVYPLKVATRSNASIEFKFSIRQKNVDPVQRKAFGSEKDVPLITTGYKSM